MEQSQLEEFLILLLAMGSSLPLDLLATGGLLFAGPNLSQEVATEADFFAAIANPELGEIILTDDIIALSRISINRREPLILNLNGFKIASLVAQCAIEVLAGQLVITGRGSIVANGMNAVGVCLKGAMTADNANYSGLSVGSEVVLYAPESYGVQIMANGNAAYGVSVEFAGKLVAKHGFCTQKSITGQGENIAKIAIMNQAQVEVDYGQGIAICAFGQGQWRIGQVDISSAIGINCQSGAICLDGPKIFASENLIDFSSDNDGKLEIKAGEFSTHGEIFANLPDDYPEIVVRGGQFYGQNFDVLTEFLAEEHHLDIDPQNQVGTIVGPRRELILDPVEKFKHEQEKLDAILARAEHYVEIIKGGDGLGEWQDDANKALTTIKRNITTTKKLLKSKTVVLEQVIRAEQKLQNAMRGIERVEDDLKAEIFSVLAMAQELSPLEYSEYSYNLLAEAMRSAERIIKTPHTAIDELYSILCDLNLNLDLLEGPEEVSEPFIRPTLEVSPELPPETPPVTALEPAVEPLVDSAEISAWMDLGAAVILSRVAEPESASADESEVVMGTPMTTEPGLTAEELSISEPAPEPEVDTYASAAFFEACQNLRVMLEAVRDLRLSDYKAEFVEQFGELQVAIVKSQAILEKSGVTLPEILDVMDELKFATTGLNLEESQPEPHHTPEVMPEPPRADQATVVVAQAPTPSPATPTPMYVDWSALREAVAEIAVLEASDYTYESYQRVLTTLEQAKALLARSDATQAEIDDLVFDLNLAMLGLEYNLQAPVSTQFSEMTTPSPAALPQVTRKSSPNLFSSIAAGVSSGLTTYRKSRIITKRQKLLRKAQTLSKLA